MDTPATSVEPKKRVVFLFSDTGGGHRSATEAMIEALDLEFPGQFESSKIDFFKEYYPKPFSYAPELYPPMAKFPAAWGLSYKAFDGKHRSRAANRVTWPLVRKGARALVRENPADLFVSVHPLVNTAMVRAMQGDPRRFITVVTDMVSTHAFWFDYRADLIIVPTPEAMVKAVETGVPAGNVRVVGLPIADRFTHLPTDRPAIRERLGWVEDLPCVLLVGGGDGMGPLEEVAKALDKAHLKAQLAVICGRNEHLRERLDSHDWKIPVHTYGFTRDMPDFMAAADMIVTKAGPGTICEAFAARLPLILYSRMPGQEDGNVTYVVQHEAGVWAPRPWEVVQAVTRWVEDPEARVRASEAAARVAKPQAARDIARIIADHARE
ncbi:MAG: glycosyltransferase [Micropruina sp.]|nr:glycosyltransferase [Micropruina sp.]